MGIRSSRKTSQMFFNLCLKNFGKPLVGGHAELQNGSLMFHFVVVYFHNTLCLVSFLFRRESVPISCMECLISRKWGIWWKNEGSILIFFGIYAFFFPSVP